MGLDMYLNKVKRNKVLNEETTIRVAEDFYSKDDRNAPFFKPFEDACLTYTYIRWDWKGEETYLNKNIAYWRKANAIHKWIYDNCAEDGQRDYDYIIVERDKIEELIKTCKKVLDDLEVCPKSTKEIECGWSNGKTIFENINTYDSKVALELLPPQEGFFFGSYEIGDFYKEDLKHTIEQLTKVLIETDWKNEVVYYYASY